MTIEMTEHLFGKIGMILLGIGAASAIIGVLFGVIAFCIYQWRIIP